MHKTLIAIAAAAFVLSATGPAQAAFAVPSLASKSIVHKICDDEDNAEDMEDADAYAAASYGAGRRTAQPQSRMQAPKTAAARATPEPKQSAESRKPETKSDVANDDEPKRSEKTKGNDKAKSVASNDARTCKQYFPAVNMALTVPCDDN